MSFQKDKTSVRMETSAVSHHDPDIEVLDAKIASVLNRIIQNTRFKIKVSLEESQRRPFLSRKIDFLLDLRILPGHWS